MGSWSGAGSPGKAPRAGSSPHSSTSTGAPVTPSKVALPTKCRLAGVWITRTACPSTVARRTSSTALYAAIPPETPRRIRPTAAASAVAVLQLRGSDLLEGDLEVVLRAGLDHRRRVLVESPLAEVVVVGVDLSRALGGDEHARVVRVDLLEQFVQSWLDQGGHMLAARSTSSCKARSRSSFTTRWPNSSLAASSSGATASRRSICCGESEPRVFSRSSRVSSDGGSTKI